MPVLFFFSITILTGVALLLLILPFLLLGALAEACTPLNYNPTWRQRINGFLLLLSINFAVVLIVCIIGWAGI